MPPPTPSQRERVFSEPSETDFQPKSIATSQANVCRYKAVQNEEPVQDEEPFQDEDPVQTQTQEVKRFCSMRPGRLLILALVGVSASIIAAGIATRTWRPWCLPALAGAPVSMFESSSESSFYVDFQSKRDAVSEWLLNAEDRHTNTAMAARNAGADLRNEADTAIDQAITAKDPAEARRIIDQLVRSTVRKARPKHRRIGCAIPQSASLRGHFSPSEAQGTTLAPFPNPSRPIPTLPASPSEVPAIVGGDVSSAGHADARRKHLVGRSRRFRQQRGAYVAHCVFDSLQAINNFAFLASDLNDASKTCAQVALRRTGREGLLSCAMNVAFALTELAKLASSLSLAASDCASTIVPDVDATCAASVADLVSALSQMAGSGALVAASCTGKVPSATSPSTFGLETNQTKAQPRKLLYGGGIASDETQCGVQISGILWALGQAATYITQASRGNIGRLGKCPPWDPSRLRRLRQASDHVLNALCVYNVAGILVAYTQVIEFVQSAIVSCQNTFNFEAICGAGITGLLASLAGITHAGSGIYLACKVFQDKLLKQALNAARRKNILLGGALVRHPKGAPHPIGRRMSKLASET